MRTHLMAEAMCLDLSLNVTADYACANTEFSYFCSHSVCLQEVRPKKIVNAHFFAPGMHVPGCPNEPEKSDGDGTAQKPAKRVSIVAPPAVPTELGPAKSRKGKVRKPTKVELLALSDALEGKPPGCAGTLIEVVNAWRAMPKDRRPEKQLSINDEKFTYESAFYCISEFGESPIEQLPCTTRVIHGAARVEDAENCYWIRSVKTFPADNCKVNLIIRVPKDNGITAKYMKDLLAIYQGATSFTLFYFGDVPKLSASGKSYGISKDISNDYERFVVVPD